MTLINVWCSTYSACVTGAHPGTETVKTKLFECTKDLTLSLFLDVLLPLISIDTCIQDYFLVRVLDCYKSKFYST